MTNNSILTAGVNELKEIKDTLLSLDQYKENNAKLEVEEVQLERGIEARNKELNDEILMLVKKREEEVTSTYDSQLNRTRNSLKKVKSKKEKKKSEKVSERIEEETAELQEENKALKLEAKETFSQHSIPKIYNTRVFFALFSPKGVSDFGIILIALVCMLYAIPQSIYHFLFGGNNIFLLILTYVVIVVGTVALYFLIGNQTIQLQPQAFGKVKNIRIKIRRNNKEIRSIKKEIKKDKDESGYGLSSFDKEIEEFEDKLRDIEEQKKEALLTFENTTKQVITNEIRNRYTEKIEALQQQLKEKIEQIKHNEEKIKELTVYVANTYEMYLGKDIMDCNTIDQLIGIMEQSSVNTISEAIQIYKRQMGS